jgi:hypothetical protein
VTGGGPQPEQRPIPNTVRSLLPLAHEWGLPDDVYRSMKVEDASTKPLQDLVDAFAPVAEEVYGWLAATDDPSDPTYIALKCLSMAEEEARVILRLRATRVYRSGQAS